MVYINLDEDPVSPNHRPQVRKQYENLEPGESEIISEDFSPLEHLDNLYLINVFQITVIADPKSLVDELNETNNEKVIPVPH